MLTYASAFAVTCNTAQSNTPERITACISKARMINSMQNIQAISDNNIDHTFDLMPGGPHGSRYSGTPGDIASKDYIKQVLQNAGYKVTVQQYDVLYSADRIVPVFEEIGPVAKAFIPGEDFSTPIYDATGDVTAKIQYVKGIVDEASTTKVSSAGCNAADFAGANFVGKIALMERGTCPNREKILNAIAAGAIGAITFNSSDVNTGNTLISQDGMTIPAVAYIKRSIGLDLYHSALAQDTTVHLKTNIITETRTTYNVVADSKWGDPNNTVLLVSHYDSIFGAGMSDNAGGVVSIMEVALAMKDTPTLNHVRFLLTGGEELGLFGVQHYIDSIRPKQNQIGFVLDSDNASTNNFFAVIAGLNDNHFKNNYRNSMINATQLGVNMLVDSLTSQRVPIANSYLPAGDGTFCGTDGCAFGDEGIPWTNIFAGQGDFAGGKTQALVNLYAPLNAEFLLENPASHTQNFVGSSDVCMDSPYVFCDNLSNVNYEIMDRVTKAYAVTAIKMAFTKNLNSGSQNIQDSNNYKPKHTNWGTRTHPQ